MNNQEMEHRKGSIKSKIESLIQNGYLNEAKEAILKYEAKVPGDQDICSMLAVIHIVEGDYDEAEKVILGGLKKDSVHFDLLYNLAYIYEQRGQLHKAADLYYKAGTVAKNDTQQSSVDDAMNHLKLSDSSIQVYEKERIVFFVKAGLDNFLSDIIQGLSDDFFIRKIIVSDLKQIDEGMEWADVCWFEWCDELVIYGSRLPLAWNRRIICRLHRYEAFSDYIAKVAWDNVDKVIFVAEHIKDVVAEKVSLPESKCKVIFNGIDAKRFEFVERKKGFNLAWIGYLNLRKNPMLVLQYFNELVKKDNRYKLHIAGTFQDETLKYYFNDMIKRLKLEANVIQYGFIPNEEMNEWLKDKNYIVTGSIAEGHPVGIMEAMSCGLKPVIHYYPGVESQYPRQFIVYDLEDFIRNITGSDYNSYMYHSFIKQYYSLEKQLDAIRRIIEEILSYRNIIGWTNDVINGISKCDELLADEITILTPTYNRAQIVRDDFEKGFSFPSLPKLIVDDCSEDNNRQILRSLERESRYGDLRIHYRDVNGGVASAFSTGFDIIKSKFILIKGDDDILLYRKGSEDINEVIQRTGIDFSFAVPRYVINLMDDGTLSLGYDRGLFYNMMSSQILKQLFITGEMSVLMAGAVFRRDDLLNNRPEQIFRVSEDYVTITRVLNQHSNIPIRILDSLVYVRRISSDSLSRKVDYSKLTLHLMSMMISGYYCLKEGLVDNTEFIESIRQRESLLNNYYDYEKGFSEIVEKYTNGMSDIEFLIKGLADRGVSIHEMNELPKEIIDIPNIFK